MSVNGSHFRNKCQERAHFGRVHREDDECPSMGRTSVISAKKGRISDLTYDHIHEEKIQISCTREGRNVEYTPWSASQTMISNKQ